MHLKINFPGWNCKISLISHYKRSEIESWTYLWSKQCPKFQMVLTVVNQMSNYSAPHIFNLRIPPIYLFTYLFMVFKTVRHSRLCSLSFLFFPEIRDTLVSKRYQLTILRGMSFQVLLNGASIRCWLFLVLRLVCLC